MIEKTGVVAEPVVPIAEPEVSEVVEPVAPIVPEIVERPEEEGLSDTEITNLRAGFDVKDFIEKNKDILVPVTSAELQIGDEVFAYGKDINGELRVTNKSKGTLFFENIIRKEKGDARLEILGEKKLGKKNQIYFVNDIFAAYEKSIPSTEDTTLENQDNYQAIETPFDKQFKEDLKAIISDGTGIKINSLSAVTVESRDNKIYVSYKIKNQQNVKEQVDVVFGLSDDGTKFVVEKSEKEGQPFPTPELEKEFNDYVDEDGLVKKIEIEEGKFTTYE